MRYYKKEHTIKMLLTGLFPMITPDDLLAEIRASYKAVGFDYKEVLAEQEREAEEKFLEQKELLLAYCPEELKPVIERDKAFPIKGLPKSIIDSFNNWERFIIREVNDCFDEYDQYYKKIEKALPNGCRELNECHMHDSKIIDHRFEGEILTMRIHDVSNKVYDIVFFDVDKFESDMDINNNIWKQHEIYFIEDGAVEINILSDALDIESMVDAINETRIICSDIKIMPI